jgi:hypothetical protein
MYFEFRFRIHNTLKESPSRFSFHQDLGVLQDVSEEILEKVKGLVGSLKQARNLHEIPYAQEREELIRKFESLKRRADQIKNSKTRAKAYRLLAKLEQLLTDPPAYSLKICSVGTISGGGT